MNELIRIKATAQKFSGDNADAHANYKKLIQDYEMKRAVSVNVSLISDPEITARWFAGIVPVYKDAAAVSAAVDDTDFAFYCTEFCKGRNLIDTFDDVLAAKDYLLTPAEKNVLADNQNALNAVEVVAEYAAAIDDDSLHLRAEMTFDHLRVISENFKSDLREKYSANAVPKNLSASDVDDYFDKLDVLSWDAILKNFDVGKNQRAIPDGACLIEFMKTADSLVVTFLRNEGDVQAATIPVDEKFFAHCRSYHESNSKDSAIFMEWRQKYCDELSGKLMPTLEKFAGESRHWIISPDAELNLVPFETLKYRGKFLLETVDVSYVPSLAVMNMMKNRERKNSHLGRDKKLFAMGDAIYGDTATGPRGGRRKFSWKSLPGTARELDAVSPLFDGATIFRREQASEKNLRDKNLSGELSRYEYLLFATHGMFDSESPEFSAIVLSQNDTDDYDGYVTVGEWMSYDLRSNLIYLSACESGRGDYRAGEGIVGIPYALTVAGNKDTVMSLWEVDDTATAEFTAAVFEKLRRGQTEVGALNNTKREFLKRDPSIWAAFVLYGI